MKVYTHDGHTTFIFGNGAAQINIFNDYYHGPSWEYWHANRKMKSGRCLTIATAIKKAVKAKRLYKATYSGTFPEMRKASKVWNSFH